MEVSGKARIAAAPMTVWAGLNDPAVLRAALPGAREVTQLSATRFSMSLAARIGPLTQAFTGELVVTERNPPHGHVIAAEGTNRFFGQAWGEARIALEPAHGGEATWLSYTVSVGTRGRLARFARPIIQRTGETMVAQFFERFRAAVEAGDSSAESACPDAPPNESES